MEAHDLFFLSKGTFTVAMTKRQKKLARLAAVLHGKLGQEQKLPKITLPDYRWEQAEIDLQQLSRAIERGWRSALQSQLSSIVRSLQFLVNDLIVLQRTAGTTIRHRSACFAA